MKSELNKTNLKSQPKVFGQASSEIQPPLPYQCCVHLMLDFIPAKQHWLGGRGETSYPYPTLLSEIVAIVMKA